MASSPHFSREFKNLSLYVKDIDFLKLVFTFKSIETLGCMARTKTIGWLHQIPTAMGWSE